MTDTTNLSALAGLAGRLHECGPRVIYELLCDMTAGRDPAEIVADFSRLDPAIYAALYLLLAEGGQA